MNNKKFLFTSLLLVLMLALIFSQRLFQKNFKEVALIDNNMGELKEYLINKGNIRYSIPNSWSAKEKECSDYVISHIEFKDNKNNINGYIEIINTDEDIKTIAQNDIDFLALPHDKEKIENYRENDLRGIKVNYKTKLSTGRYLINNIYYIRLEEGKVVRTTFIVKEDSYKDNLKAIFDTLVSTIRSKGK